MTSYGLPVAVLCGLLCVCLADVSTQDLDSHLRSPALSQRRSQIQPENKDTTRSYIVEQWRALVEENQQEVAEYTTTSDLDQLLDGDERIVLFSQRFLYSTPTYGVNYVLIVKGYAWGTSEDRPIILGTHYDSVPDSPGTDDNGSGMAAMLEVSKTIAAEERSNYTAIFVAFDMEEYYLTGSKHFLQEILIPRLLQHYGIFVSNFQGALILDTIMNYDDTENSQNVPEPTYFQLVFPNVYRRVEENMFRGDFLLVAGRQDEGELIDLMERAWDNAGPGDVIGLEIPFTGNDLSEQELEAYEDFLRSDHANFWREDTPDVPDGLKALFITDTANFRGNMKTCYHSPCDNVDSITEKKLEFLLQVTHSLTTTLRQAISADDAADPTTTTVTEPTTTVTEPTTTDKGKKPGVNSAPRSLPGSPALLVLLLCLLAV